MHTGLNKKKKKISFTIYLISNNENSLFFFIFLRDRKGKKIKMKEQNYKKKCIILKCFEKKKVLFDFQRLADIFQDVFPFHITKRY